ncbi:MAG: sensor histidine kinase [Actinomycetes bacterium]
MTTEESRSRTALQALRSVRVRVLAALLALSALGMTVAGAAAYLVERDRITGRIDRDLAQDVEEFRTLERQGTSAATGGAFTSVEEVFVTALQQTVPDTNESIFAFVGGDVRYFSHGENAARLRRDARFLEVVRDAEARGRPTYADVDSTLGHVRVVILPVREGNQSHAWVIALATGPAYAEFTAVMRVYAQVAAGALLLVAVIGWFVAGRLLAPVRVMRRTAQRITETDLSRRIHVTGNDDVSELARTFNAMLDRLEAALTTQRQFLDDAGHELRTPITILRGHLELLDAGNASDVAETRALVLDELDRMGRLVEDLVTLAKAERPDFVQRRPVDVGVLLDDVYDKAVALGRRRWRVDARAEDVVQADAQRLTQALLQLAHNAVAFTNEADEIALGTRVDEPTATVRLWVRDTGPGVHPRDAGRIFDRLQQGAGHTEGSGLGLAIVRAIAEAHGGLVELDSVPGEGATFTIVIPRTPPASASDQPTEVLTP